MLDEGVARIVGVHTALPRIRRLNPALDRRPILGLFVDARESAIDIVVNPTGIALKLY